MLGENFPPAVRRAERVLIYLAGASLIGASILLGVVVIAWSFAQ